MKKFFLSSFVIAALVVATAFTSCNKNHDKNPGEEPGNVDVALYGTWNRTVTMIDRTDEDIERKINELFTSSTFSYSVKGDQLTFTNEDEKQEFIRKN